MCSPTHLKLIGRTEIHETYTLSANYEMGKDINLNNESFTPIAGTFTGVFNGRGYKIMNLTINSTGPAALFLELGGRIQNLGIEDFHVVGLNQISSLVAVNKGTITHCYATDSDSSTDLTRSPDSPPSTLTEDHVGGLVAELKGGQIISSYTISHIRGGNNSYVGGLVGQLQDGRIISSYAMDTINGEESSIIGGLVGFMESGQIVSSYATGNTYGGDETTGPILALASSSGWWLGGDFKLKNTDHLLLVGQLQEDGGQIISSYATGETSGGDDSILGGLVGFATNNSRIAFSYSTGDSHGADGSDISSLVGAQNDSQIISSYGFGIGNGENSNALGTPPEGVDSASDLTQENSGNTDKWPADAWNFGTFSQQPVLKYVDGYSFTSGTYTCTSTAAFLPPVTINCGTTLLSGQTR